MAFLADDGKTYEITQKGVMTALLIHMVPGLDVYVAEELVRQLIEDAVDRTELNI